MTRRPTRRTPSIARGPRRSSGRGVGAQSFARTPKSVLIKEVTRLRASVVAHRNQKQVLGELEAARAALAERNEQLMATQRELGDLVDEYYDLYDCAPVGYVMLNEVGTILQLNLAACRLLRDERAMLIDRPLIGKIEVDDRKTFFQHLRRCGKSDESVESELRMHLKNGEVIPVQLSSRRAVMEQSVMFRTVLVDLRERVRLEDERHKAEQDEQRHRASNEAKDRFLAMLSHELRTPLTPALFAAAHLLDLRDLSREGQHLAEVIRRSIELEAELIDQLLDVTRIRTGKLVLERERVDLEQIIRQAIEICQPQLASRNQRVVLDLRARNREMLGDPARLRQAFWNLVQNASKFSPSGARIDVASDDTGEGQARITVEDCGVGMSHDQTRRLFTPFEAAERGKRGSGLGLGLSICRGIIEGHGGSVDGTSAGPGQGAVFTVELSAQPLSGVACVESPAADRVPTLSMRPGAMRILLVEDDCDSGEVLAELLAHIGHEVTVARSVAQATAHVGEPWDVVVSDIGLPDGSGLEIAQRFRAAANGQQQLLIAMSGYGASTDIASSRQAGFDEHLVKPVDFNLLLTAMRGRTVN